MASGGVAVKRHSSTREKPYRADEPLRIRPVSTCNIDDIGTLKAQHAKLKQRMEVCWKKEIDLLNTILELETRQTEDDTVINIINRYWNQLNEDIWILLQRFDLVEIDQDNDDCENATCFLAQLSAWDKSELDEQLRNKVEVSKTAVAKIIQSFEWLQQRNELVTKAIQGSVEGNELSPSDIIKDECQRIKKQNIRLDCFNIFVQEKLQEMCDKHSSLADDSFDEGTKTEDLKNKVEDLEWDLKQLTIYNNKLTYQIQDLQEKCKRFQQKNEREGCIKKGKDADVSDTVGNFLRKDMEETREQAANRLNELDKLHKTHCERLNQLEKLRMDIRQPSESVVKESEEYKCLQYQFSIVCNDAQELRSTLLEAKDELLAMRTNNLKHVEHMESEELLRQKVMRKEMVRLGDMVGVVRNEYELLKLELKYLATTEEKSGLIEGEMRNLITSLENHNEHLKCDLQRYRRKYKSVCSENSFLRLQKRKLELQIQIETLDLEETAVPDSTLDDEKDSKSLPSFLNETTREEYPVGEDSVGYSKREEKSLTPEIESEAVEALRAQVKLALNNENEMKLLVDMYKEASEDPRSTAELIAAENKVHHKYYKLQVKVDRLHESARGRKKKLADEETLKKIKSFEEALLHSLQRQVTHLKTEQDTIVSEMEVTGQALEDIQEQNFRLLRQLKEQDDANFKLLSARVKAASLHKFITEEQALIKEHTDILSKQVEAKSQVVRKLEEKEALLLTGISSMETNGVIWQKTMEIYKRKTIESAQSVVDLKLHLEKYHLQIKDAEETLSEKTSALEAEAYKTKRLQENITLVKRKIERLNKIEMSGNTDEVMMEEIREYKEMLTCPSCKVRRKDAVLIKCFHVFCFDCLRTRYETRQRKCPECNAGFGANDYHRLYLG